MISVGLHAESFTVLAKSGLNIRKEANGKSEKIGQIPFGTVVEAEIDYARDLNNGYSYKHFSEIIEGKRGFWVKITFGKIEGYIFSGFGLVGEWVVKPSEINRDCRLIGTGKYCNAINYDPKLNWYAVVKDNGKLAIKKSEVIIRLIHEYNEQDTIGEDNGNWTGIPLVVQSNLKDSVFFLIGSKVKLDEGAVVSQFLANKWGYGNFERFLYPEQKYELYYEGRSYQFRAFEDVKITNDNSKGYIKQYQIGLGIGTYPETKWHNLSNELELKSPAEIHCNYKTPQLIWVGDLNKDGLLDFIYYSHTMSDSCGVCGEYHFFLSDKSNPDKPIIKVANNFSCSCGG